MKHSEVKGANLTQVVDSSVNNPFADTMRENWENLAAAFNPVVATGAPLTLAEMMGGTLGAAPQLAPLPASGAGGAATTSSMNPYGFGFSLAVTQNVQQPTPEPPSKKRRAGAKNPDSPSNPTPKQRPGGKAKAGRPRRDVVAEAEKAVASFSESVATDTTYYGDNFKTRDRNTKRLIEALEARIAAEDCSVEEAQQLTVLLKQIGAILKICKYIVASGIESEGFMAAFDTQVKFLQLEPTADIVWPSFMLCKRHESYLRTTSSAAFLLALQETELIKNGFDKDTLQEVQRRQIIERTVSLTKCGKAEDAALARRFVNQKRAFCVFWLLLLPPSVRLKR